MSARTSTTRGSNDQTTACLPRNQNSNVNAMTTTMAHVGLKQLHERFETLFSALWQIKNWIDEDSKRRNRS